MRGVLERSRRPVEVVLKESMASVGCYKGRTAGNGRTRLAIHRKLYLCTASVKNAVLSAGTISLTWADEVAVVFELVRWNFSDLPKHQAPWHVIVLRPR